MGAPKSINRKKKKKYEFATNRILAVFENSINDQKKAVDKLLETREGHVKEFNGFRKCLCVLLNDSFLHIALIDPSIIRELTNKYAHVSSSVISDQIMDSVSYAEDLYKTANEDLPNINVQQVVSDLSKTLYKSNDYFESEDLTVKKTIDNHIEGRVNKDANIAFSAADYRVLLSVLDGL